jgi:hypothetical protein
MTINLQGVVILLALPVCLGFYLANSLRRGWIYNRSVRVRRRQSPRYFWTMFALGILTIALYFTITWRYFLKCFSN